MAIAISTHAQVLVKTIGGGVRTDCGTTAGFAAGNTYTQSQFNQPYSTALDSQGNLWLADRNNSDIEQITQAGNIGSSLTYQIVNGTNKHPFPNVIGVAIDAYDDLYVLTTTNLWFFASVVQSAPGLNFLFSIPLSHFSSSPATAFTVGNDPSTNIYITFAGGSSGTVVAIPQPYSGAFSTIVSSYPFAPAGIAIRNDGTLGITDTLNDGIYVVGTNSGLTPVLVTGGHGPGSANGSPTFAAFNQPHGITATGDGHMVVCDTGNNFIRLIDSSYNTTTLYGTASNVWTPTICSDGLYAGWVDGAPGINQTNASGREPVSVTISTNGTLFITELYYNLLRACTGTGLTPAVVTAPTNLSSTNLPTVTTLAATAVTGTSATLNASVFPNGSAATVYFDWGTNTSYGSNTSTVVVSTNLGGTNNVQITLNGLQPNTTYDFEAIAYNIGGSNVGVNRNFVTSAGPAVSSEPASSVTFDQATLNGLINPEGLPTSYYFEYGFTTNYGNFTATNSLSINLNSNQPVFLILSNLLSGTNYHFQVVAYNTAGTNGGGDVLFQTQVAPPTLIISPSFGYFPECQTILVTSSVSTVYFTEDGTAVTTNSPSVLLVTTNSAGLYVGSFEWCNSQADLTELQMLAVNATNEITITGGGETTNVVGFTRGPTNGIGSWAYIPIVVDLRSNVSQIETLQFRVEVTPTNGNTHPVQQMALLPIASNDLVQMIGPVPGNGAISLNAINYSNTVSPNGDGLVVYTTGPGGGLNISGFGVVGLLQFQIPNTATVGQQYDLSILYPSATAVGGQVGVGIGAMPDQILTVADLPYLAGDSAPAYGYDSEEFGDGILDNRDVNNAIYVALGLRNVPVESDLYNAMCMLPQTANLNGSGVVQFNDWNEVLNRSLGFDLPNWTRAWSASGLIGTQLSGTLGLPGNPAVPTDAAAPSGPPPGLVWSTQATVTSTTFTNVQPGQTISFPVYVNVQSGNSVSGMQFRAIVSPNGTAPAVSEAQFAPAKGIPEPLDLQGLAPNDIPVAWETESFIPPLQKSNYLGTVSFQIPSTAQSGQCYALHFSYVDGGSTNGTTDYAMESFPGYAWVQSTALQPPSITSDEWKAHFFGSYTNSLAADDVDADGDGLANWQEYLAGTDPTNPQSVLGFSGGGITTNGSGGISVGWLTAPGKTYVLQSIPAIGGKTWTPINTNTGDGNIYQFTPNLNKGNAAFYRILLQP
jgi:hypothetical protein